MVVRGEKQWQAWAQDLVDQLDRATLKANTRPPYQSELQMSILAESSNLAHVGNPVTGELIMRV